MPTVYIILINQSINTMRKSVRRIPFDWSILGPVPKQNCLLCYITQQEPKSYYPGSENLPKNLTIVSATYTVCGIIVGEISGKVLVQIGVARTQSDQHCKAKGRKHAIERALESPIILALEADGHVGRQFKAIAPNFCHIKMLTYAQSSTNSQEIAAPEAAVTSTSQSDRTDGGLTVPEFQSEQQPQQELIGS